MPPDTSAPGQRFFKQRNRVDERLREHGVLLDAGRHREHVRVHDHVVGREAGLADEQVVRPSEDLHLAFDRVRLAELVERHDDDRRAERAHRACLLQERLFALLQRDRVHDTLALNAAQAGLEGREARAVDHDRETRGLRLGREKVQEGRHRLLGVEEVGVHVHVEQVRPASYLFECNVDRALEVVRLDQPPEPCGAGHVRALADHDESGVRPDDERLQAGEARSRRALGDMSRRKALDRADDRMRVLGRRPAATSDEVHEPVLGERAQVAARVRGLLVVEPERIRQSGVGMARDVGRGDVREPLEERPHLGRAERAVDADDERLGVLDGDPERIRGLPGEVAAALVDCGEREPERELRSDCARGHDRGLRVQRVEDRLDEQEIDAAVPQRRDLLFVGRLDRVERDSAIRRILDLWGEREGDVQRAHRAGDEAGPVRRPGSPVVGGGSRESRALLAHLRREALERVVGLADRGRGERVRRRDVGAGLEVRIVDLRDDVRRRQVQEIGVALHVARVRREPLAPVLLLRQLATVDEHAPGPVEHEDPLGEKVSELSAGVLHEIGSRLKSREPGRLARLFRRLVTRSPSCRSKLSGILRLANTARNGQFLRSLSLRTRGARRPRSPRRVTVGGA